MSSGPDLSVDTSKGHLSRRLTGAFIVIVVILAMVVMFVGNSITTESIEARAESELGSQEAIVELHFQQLEEDLIFLNALMASSQMLTEELTVPSASRSLMISLLSDLRHRGMQINMYKREPSVDRPGFSIVQKGFLGIRTLGLAVAPTREARQAWLVSVAPIETARGVDRVVALSFPLTRAYLESIANRIRSDVTLLLPGGESISTLSAGAVAKLLREVKDRGQLDKRMDGPRVLSTVLEENPAKARISAFRINLKTEGVLVLSMSMADLLEARKNIVSRVLLITLVLLSGASLLYLSLIRHITRPLGELSVATREVAAGKLDLQVAVASQDEIGELAQSFNRMIQRLRESREEINRWNQTLEKRVEERTQSLEEARAALTAMNDQLVAALDKIRRTQDQMVRTEKLAALGQMASTVAHEVRNPLAGMKGALQVLLREQVCGDRAPVVQLVIEQIDRLSETTSRLLSFARPATPRKIPSDPTELLQMTASLLAEQASQKGVQIAMKLEAPDSLLPVDPQLTLQAFLNIALNAIQAMGTGGILTIASQWDRAAKELAVRFEDTGEGMSAEVVEQIFAPFFTTKHHGTGLGLYVAKDIIEQQGGRVQVASTPGVGSVFTVRLPAHDSTPSPSGPGAEQRAKQDGEG